MRRALVAFVGVVAPLAGGVACSLRDTSYLTNGGGGDDGGSPADVASEPEPQDAFVPDGGPTRTAVTIATNQTNARLLVQDDDSLYWFAGADLVGIKKQGEPNPHVVMANAGNAIALAADHAAGSGELFFAVGPTVYRIAKTGGTATTVATTSPPPGFIAVNDDTHVFVLELDPADVDNPHIARISRSAPVQTDFLETADTVEVYALALDATNLYWDEGNNAFLSRPKDAAPDAGAPAQYPITTDPNGAEGATSPANFAVDESYFFYSDDIKLHSLGRMTGATPTVLLSFDENADSTAIAIDATFAYAIEETAKGRLLRNTKDGRGAQELMVDQLNKPSALVVDDKAVYLTVSGDGSVLRVDK